MKIPKTRTNPASTSPTFRFPTAAIPIAPATTTVASQAAQAMARRFRRPLDPPGVDSPGRGRAGGAAHRVGSALAHRSSEAVNDDGLRSVAAGPIGCRCSRQLDLKVARCGVDAIHGPGPTGVRFRPGRGVGRSSGREQGTGMATQNPAGSTAVRTEPAPREHRADLRPCRWWCARSSPGATSEGGSGSWWTSSSSSTRRSRSSSSPPPSTSPISCGTGRLADVAGTPARQVHPRIHVLRPRKWLPRVVGPFADRSLERQILDAVGRARAAPAPAVDQRRRPMPGSRCAPDGPPSTTSPTTGCWPRMAPRQRDRLMANEDLLMEHSEEVVVCSPDLARSRGGTRPVELIPNGVDVDLFRHRPAPARRPPAGAGGPLRRDTAHLAHRHPAGDRAGRGPGPTSRWSWSGRTACPATSSDRLEASPTSTSSEPGPTTRSRPTCNTPTWSSSPTWSIRSPRASIRSRPTSAWPPAGPPWPPRWPGSASWGLRSSSPTGSRFVEAASAALATAGPPGSPTRPGDGADPDMARAGRGHGRGDGAGARGRPVPMMRSPRGTPRPSRPAVRIARSCRPGRGCCPRRPGRPILSWRTTRFRKRETTDFLRIPLDALAQAADHRGQCRRRRRRRVRLLEAADPDVPVDGPDPDQLHDQCHGPVVDPGDPPRPGPGPGQHRGRAAGGQAARQSRCLRRGLTGHRHGGSDHRRAEHHRLGLQPQRGPGGGQGLLGGLRQRHPERGPGPERQDHHRPCPVWTPRSPGSRPSRHRG